MGTQIDATSDPCKASFIRVDDWHETTVEGARKVQINLRSLLHLSGIPREAVRRKLGIPLDKG